MSSFMTQYTQVKKLSKQWYINKASIKNLLKVIIYKSLSVKTFKVPRLIRHCAVRQCIVSMLRVNICDNQTMQQT